MPGDPGHQIPLVLPGKLHDGGILLDGAPELFQPLVRLPFHGLIGEDHRAPLRDIREEFAHFVPLCLRHFKQLHLVHLDEGVLCHHGHSLHRIAELLQSKVLVVKAVGIEGFGNRVQQLLTQLTQIVLQEKYFLTMENIQPAGLLVFQLLLQFGKSLGPGRLLCHGAHLLKIKVPCKSVL